jgi:hypothetical protein
MLFRNHSIELNLINFVYELIKFAKQ